MKEPCFEPVTPGVEAAKQTGMGERRACGNVGFGHNVAVSVSNDVKPSGGLVGLCHYGSVISPGSDSLSIVISRVGA